MGSFQFLLKIILIILLIHCDQVFADCKVCQTNGAACLNQTAFQLCYGGVRPVTSQIFNCLDGFDCTNTPNICFQRGVWAASCGDLSKCGICNADNVFACTSRTTFKFCFGSNSPSDVLGYCPTGHVCDNLSKDICVPRDRAKSIGCDIDAV